MRNFCFDSTLFNEFIKVADLVIDIVPALVMPELFLCGVEPDRRQRYSENFRGLLCSNELKLIKAMFIEIPLDGGIQALAESINPVKNRLIWVFHNYDLMRVSISENGRRSDTILVMLAIQPS